MVDNYRELVQAILTQTYQDYGEVLHSHVCGKCWLRWGDPEKVSVCPRCQTRNDLPANRRYTSSDGIRSFLDSDWCKSLCDFVEVDPAEYRRRVLRFARTRRITRGEVDG